ncbi:MAG: laccase domain-containing protein [Planctomycetes bacterium]|nr:laccase domain-containing protein [Planctomycetota bacterium]
MTTSDCRFIAIVHCGWRPLYFNIVIQAIDLIQEKSCIEPREIQAAIWPGICFSCYKVGDEFEKYFPGKIRKNRFDLAEEVRAQLELSGVYNIMMAEPIKFCSAHTLDSGQFVFHSRRRERNGCMNSALIAF